MIRVGLIGCGVIADQHAELIAETPDCKLVAFCDREELMAKQMYERFNADYYFSDAAQFLEKSRLDVVHITTPPQAHFELGRLCIEAGCSVYIEKPFTIIAEEARELIDLAVQKNVKVTTGNNLQFSHAARRTRKLVNQGALGGPPVHIESYYGYDLGDVRYAKALLADRNHWVRKLPGQILHNIISHGICKIAEYIKSDNPTVIAHGFTSPMLRSIEDTDIIDELRVIINDDDNTTAYFTFSTQMRPKLRHLRIYGPKHALIVDDDDQTVIKVRGEQYKSYLNHFIPPLEYSRQYIGNLVYNASRFICNDFHMGSGMKYLIREFYRSVRENTPPPIPYREILLTEHIMDEIFKQLRESSKRETRT